MNRRDFLKKSCKASLAIGSSVALQPLLNGCVSQIKPFKEEGPVIYPKLSGQKIQSPEHYGLDGCMVGFFNGGVFSFSDRGVGYLMELILKRYEKKGIQPSVMFLGYKTSRLTKTFSKIPS